jgi:hypothetical protein
LNNGSNGSELETLKATYPDCGYVFRHYEDCEIPFMRWQAGRDQQCYWLREVSQPLT